MELAEGPEGIWGGRCWEGWGRGPPTGQRYVILENSYCHL